MRYQLRTYQIVIFILGIFMVALGLKGFIWNTYISLPHEYAILRNSGVQQQATLEKCAAGLGGGKGVACQRSISTPLIQQTWVYPIDVHQFHGMRVGEKIPVIVDSTNPKNIYTVHDVKSNMNVDSLPLTIFGIIFTLFGFALLLILYLISTRIKSVSNKGF